MLIDFFFSLDNKLLFEKAALKATGLLLYATLNQRLKFES